MTDNLEENPFESPQEGQTSLSDVPMPGESPLQVVFPISAILFVISTALLVVQPGVGLLGYLISMPGVAHGFIRISRKQMAEGAMTRNEQMLQLFISLLIMIPVFVAAAIAFGVVCFGGAMIAPSVLKLQNDDYGFGAMLLIGVPAGILAALGVGVYLFILTLPKKVQVPVEKD